MKKKYIVTGGAGFIGSNLINYLLKKTKRNIVSIDSYYCGSKLNHVKSQRVKYLKGSTKNIFRLLKNEKPYQVFHFGEFPRIYQSFKYIDDCLDSNFTGTYQVLKYCLNKKIKIIYSGSSSIFGNNFEDQNLAPYPWIKSKNVELIKNLSKWFGLKYSITYFYNVYGLGQIKKGELATVIGIFENQYFKNIPLTVVSPGNLKRDFTHVSDIVNGCYLSSKVKKNCEYMLGTGKSYSILKIAKMFNHPIKFIPERIGERLYGKANIRKAKNELGYKPKIKIEEYIKLLTKK